MALPSLDAPLDDLVEAAETSEAVWDALGKLSPNQRTAIVLRYYLDMSEADMSDRLECPPGTVKWRLHAARERLRRILPAWVGRAEEDEPPTKGAGPLYSVQPAKEGDK